MGLFSIFTKSRKQHQADLSLVGVDVHSHFIPGIDDGSENMSMSLEMIKAMSELGYRKVITTPHIMGDFFKNTPEIILSGLEQVRNELRREQIPIELDAAAEYYLDFDFPFKLGEGNLLTFGGNYLLFELSYLNPPDSLNQMIFEIQTRGFKPVLAHPERYPYFFHNPEIYREIREKGALLQLNINSLSGYYSPDTRRVAMWLIDQQLIDFLGSDCHHPGHINLIRRSSRETHLSKLIDSGRLLNPNL